MATLYDGARVFTAAAGGTALASEQNDLQDQLISGLAERERDWMFNGFNDPGNTTWNSWQNLPQNGYCLQTTHNSMILWVPFFLRVNEVLTEVSVSVTGLTGALGGSIDFVYGDGAGVVAQAIDGGAANPWDTGGTAYGNLTTYTLSAAPLPLTTPTDDKYAFKITSGTNSATHANYLWNCNVKTEFSV
jgi:hypothetical protein